MNRTSPGKIDALAYNVASGLSVMGAAKVVGIPPRTARDLVKRDDYQQAIGAARKAILEQVVDGLTSVSREAVKVCLELLKSDSEEIRLRAMKEALANLVPLASFAQLTARIERLEAQARDQTLDET